MLLLSILGVLVGYYMSPLLKKYESRILLSPSFETVDYLYNEIDLINSKIKDRDTIYLKSIGFTSPVSKISIEPVTSVYEFVQENERNFDLIKLFAEDGDINKVAEDEKTSKNYKIHQITITTKDASLKDQNIDQLISTFNMNSHYNKIKDVSNENNAKRIITNNNTIAQINSVLDKFKSDISNNKSSNLVYFNDNNQLNEIIATKNILIKENEYLELQKINSENFIKKTSQFLNIQQESKSNILVLSFPLLFILIYFLFKQLLTFKKQ